MFVLRTLSSNKVACAAFGDASTAACPAKTVQAALWVPGLTCIYALTWPCCLLAWITGVLLLLVQCMLSKAFALVFQQCARAV